MLLSVPCGWQGCYRLDRAGVDESGILKVSSKDREAKESERRGLRRLGRFGRCILGFKASGRLTNDLKRNCQSNKITIPSGQKVN